MAQEGMLMVTPEIEMLADVCREHTNIPAELYRQYDVKRGLRDLDGVGVLAGLTNISSIISSKDENGVHIPIPGELRYRGYDIKDLVRGFLKDGRKGYEETAYLLLFGRLPARDELAAFKSLLAKGRTLPTNFTRDVIMKAPSHDIMN